MAIALQRYSFTIHDIRRWVVSLVIHLPYSQGNNLRAHCIGVCAGHRASVDIEEKKNKSFAPTRNRSTAIKIYYNLKILRELQVISAV
jgi:hypothetical protein